MAGQKRNIKLQYPNTEDFRFNSLPIVSRRSMPLAKRCDADARSLFGGCAMRLYLKYS